MGLWGFITPLFEHCLFNNAITLNFLSIFLKLLVKSFPECVLSYFYIRYYEMWLWGACLPLFNPFLNGLVFQNTTALSISDR